MTSELEAENSATDRARAITYVAVAAVLTLLYAGLRDSTWVSSAAFHTLLEVVATLLALMVGVLGLVRHRVDGRATVFFVGMAFLGTGFLDGFHAVVTSTAVKDYLPSGLPSLIPWSWVASRAFLALMMWLSWMAWRREQRLGPAGRIPEALVYSFVILLTLISYLFFAFTPLPRAYYPELFFHRPEEFVPALFFLLALVGYLRKGHWKHDLLEHWLVLSLIVGFLGQAMFMSFSGKLFDTMFDAAHSLKVVSYICVMAGLFMVMVSSRSPQASHHIQAEDAESAGGLSIGWLKALAYGTSSLLCAVMIGTVVLGVRTVDDFNRLQDEWDFYTEHAEKRGLLLSRIRGSMGYGGFIHDFKNYVLRQDEPRYKKVAADLTAVDRALHDYRDTFSDSLHDHDHGLGEEESRALQALEEVVDQYRSKLAVARESVALGRTPNQTDPLVAVDDGPALAAITTLERLWNEARISETMTATIIDGRNSVRQGMLFLPVLLITLILLLWLLRGLVREIADRARAEANLRDSEGRIRAVVDNVVDGIITIDDQGQVESFNPAAEQIFGYLSEEIIGRNVKVLMPEPYHGEHDGYLDNYRRTNEARIIGIGREVEGQRSDGSTFPLELAVGEMVVGGRRMFTGIVRDITERKKVDRMKNEFISTVSHELRTPLTSIMGSLGLIRGGATGDIPGEASSLLDIAHNNADRLIKLINDILDVEKIEYGEMDFDIAPVKVATAIRGAIESNLSYAEQYHARLVSEDAIDSQAWEATVAADPDRLAQVFANLISNAAKFSPKGGEVVISAVSTDNGVQISVTDSGPGIPEEFKRRMFQKFAQADSSDTRAKGGTGLGLSICKAILDRLGGTIGFKTKEGKGTTFYFELPLWDEDKKSAAASAGVHDEGIPK
ncbi:MAG: PAS domain S-box protein [Alphaproteobacteria bacterium]|nr:PAS domain S-box protein [Alphaproteobacteria bacterium]